MVDFKYVYKFTRLTQNQKRVFTELCLMPTSHPYGAEFKSKCGLTAGGIRSALQVLQKRGLILKDPSGVWRLRDPGMMAWWYAVQTSRPVDEIESLRFGESPQQQNILKLLAVEYYAKGIYGIGKACELCGVGRNEFLQLLKEKQVFLSMMMRSSIEIFAQLIHSLRRSRRVR